MSANKKTDAAAPTTKSSAPTSTPAGSIASIWLATKAKFTKDPIAGNLIKSNGQISVAEPSGFKFIFEDEMLQQLMLLNA
ncbi:hypothetical protein KCU95_g7748, partial [Aureobasidium melanogenum]